MLTTDQKGAVAETALVHAAVRLGYDAYVPVAAGGRYDLVIDVGTRLLRVQCKWAHLRDDVIGIRCSSSRRNRHGIVHRRYSEDEADALGAYCAEIDRCFLVPPELFTNRRSLSLRLGPARNGQKVGINPAETFDFGATLLRLRGP